MLIESLVGSVRSIVSLSRLGAFKVEVALEDIADQFVAAADSNDLHRVEIDHRRRNPIQMILSQPVVNDEVRALEDLWLDVLDSKLDSCS
jgi:hypothetical protein